MKFSLGILVALGTLAALPLLAGEHARHHRFGGPGRAEMRLEHMAQALDLTDEQRQQVQQIFERHRAGSDALRDARRDLAVVIHDESASEQQVIDAAARVSAHAQQKALERHRMIIEISHVLTEEQRVKARELHQRHAPLERGEDDPSSCED